MNESILDFPQEGLCKDVWQQMPDKTYSLTPEAENTISQIASWAQTTFSIPDMHTHITGSITSNSYSSNSDVDIHFVSSKLKKDKVDDFNKLLRAKFEEFIQQNPQLSSIGNYKTEVYMQANPFQDMMSVGCYDFTNKMWLVGPEFKDISFDPYAEYFTKDLKNVDDVIDDVRSIILQIYELSIGFIKTNDTQLKEKLSKKLKLMMSKAAQIFNSLRAKRSHKSSPKNAEEALKNRDDKNWKIADSSFKLLDKFGYLGILRACTKNLDRFDEDLSDIEAALKEIVATIGDKISAQALNDSESQFLSKLQEVESSNKMTKIWIDDVRPAPLGYIPIKSVNEFIDFHENHFTPNLVIDIDHDAGDYAKDGGDYIKILDYLEYNNVKDISIRIHSANPVGVAKMRQIIQKNEKNGWKEIFDIVNDIQQLDEDASSLVKMSVIAGLMAISGLLPANALTKQLIKAKQQDQHMTINSPAVKNAIAASATSNKMIGKMSETNLVNAVAQVLWKEARGENEGTAGRKAVASVILNRTGNNPTYIPAVLKQKEAFSCMNNYTGGWTDSTYKWYVPYNAIKDNAQNRAIWNECNEIALQLIQKKFKSTIGNLNSYLNKSTARKTAVDTWGKKCTLKVGSHHFGYLKEHDPKYVVPGTFVSWKKYNKQQNASNQNSVVVVKAGDTLGKIAKANNTTIENILKLNNDIKNPNAISIGQKIRVA